MLLLLLLLVFLLLLFKLLPLVVGFPCCSFPLGFPKFLVLRRLVEYVVFRVCSALARSCLPKAEAAVEEIVWE